MSADVDEFEDGMWQVGKLYVVYRPGLYGRRWWVLSPYGPVPFKTREEAFGEAISEALRA